jgi:hypothetical protein
MSRWQHVKPQQQPAVTAGHLCTAALAHRTSAGAAATAIRHLCDACARQLAPHWDLVAALYDGVQAAGGAAPPATNGTAASPLLEEDVHNVRFRMGCAAIRLAFAGTEP